MDSQLAVFIILLIAIQLKHFIADFYLQTQYQLANKGTYGHPGGILHSAIHGVGMLMITVLVASPLLALLLAIADMIIHYHIDWAKTKLNRRWNLKPTDSDFWLLLGLDQLLHQLTYIVIIFVLLAI